MIFIYWTRVDNVNWKFITINVTSWNYSKKYIYISEDALELPCCGLVICCVNEAHTPEKFTKMLAKFCKYFTIDLTTVDILAEYNDGSSVDPELAWCGPADIIASTSLATALYWVKYSWYKPNKDWIAL